MEGYDPPGWEPVDFVAEAIGGDPDGPDGERRPIGRARARTRRCEGVRCGRNVVRAQARLPHGGSRRMRAAKDKPSSKALRAGRDGPRSGEVCRIAM